MEKSGFFFLEHKERNNREKRKITVSGKLKSIAKAKDILTPGVAFSILEWFSIKYKDSRWKEKKKSV